MKCNCNSTKLGKISYVVCFSHTLQDEADNFSSSCVDVFIPYKGHVAGERLDVPEKNTEMIKDIQDGRNHKCLNILLSISVPGCCFISPEILASNSEAVRWHSMLPLSYTIYFTSHIQFHTRHRKQGGCWPGWFPAAEVQLSCLYCLGWCHKIARISDCKGKKRDKDKDWFNSISFTKYRIYVSILPDLL